MQKKTYPTVCVADHGYVRLRDHMGGDLNVVNAARVSMDKESQEMSDRDRSLLRFLANEKHTSPFRHAFLQFELYAPLMVARQLWKYVVGGDHVMDAWNESSRRYVTEEPTFHVPSVWRSAPENKKQGSGAQVSEDISNTFTQRLEAHQQAGQALYEEAMAQGICAEQARLFLPAYGLYVRWYWSTSLQGVIHLLAQRLEEDAQVETQEYAKAIFELTNDCFPVALQTALHSENF